MTADLPVARSRPLARAALTVACAAGLLHAASSVYWVLGGRFLLPTVGQWAVDAVKRSPLEAGALLGVIGLIKATAALVPVLASFNRIPWVRLWRGVSWAGGVLLVVYGGASIVTSGAVLLGIIRPEGGYDPEARIGHVLLWDPLFLLWGAALVSWLRLPTRTRHLR